MNHQTPLKTTLKYTGIGLLILAQASCVIEVYSDNDDGRGHNVSKVFGGIDIQQGQQAGDLESVNGSISLHDNSSAESVETVNGSITAQESVTADSLETVNGSIKAKQNLVVKDDVSTVNGSIRLSGGSKIGGDVSTVNGDIDLDATTVKHDIETVNGDIRLENNSTVVGDIIFERNGSHSDHHKPKLTIDASSSVQGTIHLYREVKLAIDEKASVGEIVRHYE